MTSQTTPQARPVAALRLDEYATPRYVAYDPDRFTPETLAEAFRKACDDLAAERRGRERAGWTIDDAVGDLVIGNAPGVVEWQPSAVLTYHRPERPASTVRVEPAA